MAGLRTSPADYPLLMRLADYYGRAHYLSGELRELAEECDRASPRFIGAAKVRRTLAELANIATQLAKRRLKLYAVPD